MGKNEYNSPISSAHVKNETQLLIFYTIIIKHDSPERCRIVWFMLLLLENYHYMRKQMFITLFFV